MTEAKHRKLKKPIAFKQNTVLQENLPYPFVYYPNHYGAFFAFRSSLDSLLTLCSCTKVAIENYISLLPLRSEFQPVNFLRFILNSYDFPFALISELTDSNPYITEKEMLASLRFDDRLCHKCNQSIPSYRYCHEMYGTAFIQNYGWYVKQAYFRFGMIPYLDIYHPNICPIEYQTEIEEVKIVEKEYQQETERLAAIASGPKRPDIPDDEITYWRNVRNEETEPMIKLRRKASQTRRAFTKKIEDIVRQEFGYRKVGEGWISETILYQIVSKVYSEYKVLFHHRPDWLNGLELDIYVPDTKTAFEYQGIQHYRPIKNWGGEKGFEQLRQRDALKVQLCKKLGIHLVKVNYTDPLTEEYVRTLLLSESK